MVNPVCLFVVHFFSFSLVQQWKFNDQNQWNCQKKKLFCRLEPGKISNVISVLRNCFVCCTVAWSSERFFFNSIASKNKKKRKTDNEIFCLIKYSREFCLKFFCESFLLLFIALTFISISLHHPNNNVKHFPHFRHAWYLNPPLREET